jgi:hypothetical protein
MTRGHNKRHHKEAIMLEKLSTDEISQIIQFLNHKNAFHFALSCSSIYDSVCAVARNHNPITMPEPWSLTKALHLRKGIRLVKSQEAADLIDLITKNQVKISQLSTRFKTRKNTKLDGYDSQGVNIHIDAILDLFSTTTGGTVDLLSRTKHDADYIIRSVPITVGHELTHISAHAMLLTERDVLSMLHYTPNLQWLSIDICSDRPVRNCLKTQCGFHEKLPAPVVLPQLQYLHTAHFNSDFCGLSMKTFKRILKATPSLTELQYSYDYDEPPTDEDLAYIASHLPNLKSLKLFNNNDSEMSDSAITDSGLIHLFKTCKIERLDIMYKMGDNLEWIANLGEYGKSLKSLSIYCENGDQGILKFGGAALVHCTELTLGGIWHEDDTFSQSIVATFPNLKKLDTSGMKTASKGLNITLTQELELEQVSLCLTRNFDVHSKISNNLLQKKNLKRIAVSGEGSKLLLFTRELLEKHVCESVTHYCGPVKDTTLYMYTLSKTFPNLRSLNIRNPITKTMPKFNILECLLDRTYFPNLEEFDVDAYTQFSIPGLKRIKKK